MPLRRLIITLLVIGPILALLAWGFTRDAKYIKSPLLAKPATPFNVTLYDGKKVTLEDFRGKAVFLNFWASWCEPCRAEARDLEAAWQKVKDKNMIFLGVALQDLDDNAKAFLQEFNISYPNGRDESGKIGVDYGTWGIPGKFFHRPPGPHHLQTCRRHSRRFGVDQARRSRQRHRQRPGRARRLSGSALTAMRYFKLFVVYAFLHLASPPLHAATTADIDDRTREIATELRCVVCQNLSVADSPSEMAQQMRAIVREQVQAGKSTDEIKDFFVSKYGEWVLLRPKTTGFSALLWILPYVVLGIGVLAALWFIRRWTAKKRPTETLPDSSVATSQAQSDALRQEFHLPDIEDETAARPTAARARPFARRVERTRVRFSVGQAVRARTTMRSSAISKPKAGWSCSN